MSKNPLTELATVYLGLYANRKNIDIARLIIDENGVTSTLDCVRKIVSRVRAKTMSIDVALEHMDDAYTISDNNYVWTASNGHITLSIEQADRLFYEYSEHGLNMTQTQMINRYGFEVWKWNSIKRVLFLNKKSNIFSPFTVQNTPKEELERFISDKIKESLNDRVNVEKIYQTTVLKEAKKRIKGDNDNVLHNQSFMSELMDILPTIKFKQTLPITKTSAAPIVVFLADLHIGAKVDGLHNTPDYSPEILKEKLNYIAEQINAMGSTEVHLFLLGDLIESFTGLNHMNSWHSIERGYFGANLVKETCEILLGFISKINNVTSISGVGGNHDRGDRSKDVDNRGEIAAIIFYILEQVLPSEIEFHFDFYCVSKLVDNVNYIILHGHHAESKKGAEYLILNYGIQGMYNLIVTGHEHALNIKKENNKYRHVVCPAIFSGNDYSERLGYTHSAGYIVSQNNKNIDKPSIIINPI
jgi:predicted phosphodiesterase